MKRSGTMSSTSLYSSNTAMWFCQREHMLCSVFTGRSVKTMEFSFGSPFDPSCFVFCISQLPKMLAEMDPISACTSWLFRLWSTSDITNFVKSLRSLWRAAAKGKTEFAEADAGRRKVRIKNAASCGLPHTSATSVAALAAAGRAAASRPACTSLPPAAGTAGGKSLPPARTACAVLTRSRATDGLF